MSGSIYIYELRCPECAVALNGVSGDRIFVCGSCAGVFAAESGQLARHSLFIARPEVTPDGQLLFLPFWRFEVVVSVWDAAGGEITTATSAGTLTSIWVPAFYEQRPNVFGNPGLNLSLARPTPEATLWPADTPIRLPGAARRRDDAAVYVQPFVSGILDREKDISGLRIDARIDAAAYWAMPFSFNATHKQLRDLLCDKVYPVAVVEQMTEIINF